MDAINKQLNKLAVIGTPRLENAQVVGGAYHHPTFIRH